MNESFQVHLNGLQEGLKSFEELLKPSSGLTLEERKQLVEIEKTIRNFTKLGIPVPDAIRSIKLELSAKDSETPSEESVDSIIGELDELIEALTELTKTAKRLQSSTSQPGREKQNRSSRNSIYYGVSIMDLIQGGHLSTEDCLELQWHKNAPVFLGKITPEGKICVFDGLKSTVFSSPSTAAAKIAQRALNGWECWRRINTDGSRTPLTEIRAQYLKA